MENKLVVTSRESEKKRGKTGVVKRDKLLCIK